ncbi:Retrovirus-related Pol polyprotein from transposon TNT 1-94 [Melia azedarach]|uniref:Retrovirus-related Pol polyprotein from transposon TNT 1-94 n=1 Tax=Melia azedarach TaxID=155640 RepID=A0ACC1WRS2_MELAZ|nr:Retrovirus-related Pol polyprotein from transposon TNT 1-94 [Melia azedarach]
MNQALVYPEPFRLPGQFYVINPQSSNLLTDHFTADDITHSSTEEAVVETSQSLYQDSPNTHISNSDLPSHSTSPNSEPTETQAPQQTQHLLPTHPMITRGKAGIFKPKAYTSITLEHHQTEIPTDVQTALSNSNWNQAMKEEFTALKENQTWSRVPYTPGMKLVGNKWVYKVKLNPDGTIFGFKARLVAKGFHQTADVDYNETYSPVVKASIIRIILSLTIVKNWDLGQVDVNNAFLNGDLVETVYMIQPEGFVDATKPNHVCKLKKALYGLKQAPRAWFEKLKNALKQ